MMRKSIKLVPVLSLSVLRNTMAYIPGYFHRLFKSVQTVESYFEKEFRDPKKNVLLQSHFKDILIITPKTSTDFFSRWRDYKSEKVQSLGANDPSTLSNVLHELAIYMLQDWKVKNALVSGLKITTEFYIQRLSQKFEKTVFDDIKNSEAWNILFSCIGEESFCRLLLDNIVLKRMPNLAFCQLSGKMAINFNQFAP
ncbi:hypothetical protein BD770DRAFT_150550 [Pilaira anomala]|nr:hypothetical protein BD770DRAFT_150550 [Pilaira anomala]